MLLFADTVHEYQPHPRLLCSGRHPRNHSPGLIPLTPKQHQYRATSTRGSASDGVVVHGPRVPCIRLHTRVASAVVALSPRVPTTTTVIAQCRSARMASLRLPAGLGAFSSRDCSAHAHDDLESLKASRSPDEATPLQDADVMRVARGNAFNRAQLACTCEKCARALEAHLMRDAHLRCRRCWRGYCHGMHAQTPDSMHITRAVRTLRFEDASCCVRLHDWLLCCILSEG